MSKIVGKIELICVAFKISKFPLPPKKKKNTLFHKWEQILCIQNE